MVGDERLQERERPVGPRETPRGMRRDHPQVSSGRETPPPHAHLSPQQLEAADVAVSVGLAVQHHLDGVLLHLRAQPRRDGSGRLHGGAGVDLDQPGPEVAPEDEVCAVQLEAALARLHVVLRHLHGVGDGPLHGRVDDAAPHGPAAPLPQVLLESGAGPHVVTGQQGAAVLVVLQVLLDGVVAQVDGAAGQGWG